MTYNGISLSFFADDGQQLCLQGIMKLQEKWKKHRTGCKIFD